MPEIKAEMVLHGECLILSMGGRMRADLMRIGQSDSVGEAPRQVRYFVSADNRPVAVEQTFGR